MEVYVEPLDKCEGRFTGIYDESDGELVAIFEKGTSENPSFGLYFENGVESVECDYCSDGVMNGDETDVDCGGSCKQPCDGGTYVSLSPSIGKSPFENFRDFFKL